jgi:dihydrodipicolinate synthase/N-acetylneuraminate lyase
MKAMMDLIGLAGGPVRPPLVDLRSDDLESLRSMIKRWHPWLESLPDAEINPHQAAILSA